MYVCRLLESLEVFVLGLAVENGSMTSLNTELVQIQVEAVGGSGGGSYTPQLNISDILVGGNITLPPALLSEGLRVANLVLLRDTLFVYDEASLNELTLGNLFISAALLERVEDLSQPVIIEFYQSEVCVGVCVCVCVCVCVHCVTCLLTDAWQRDYQCYMFVLGPHS